MTVGFAREDSMGSRSIAVVVTTIAFMTQAGATQAAEIKVLSSNAININEAYVEFTAMFEKASDHRVTTTFTTGWAGTPEITKRLQGGEMYDLVIGSRQLIDDMIKEGLLAGGRVDRQIGYRRCGTRGRAEARHRLNRSGQACPAGGKIDRLFNRS
jgi:spermidine/putrescine-binding protein